jgi:uncharacterized protein (DUF2236 family)
VDGLVSRDDLERSLSRLRAEVTDARAGLFGPDTLAWEVSREAALFLGAGRAALLQLAHPYVAYAVADHSVTRTDPLARFRTTFQRIFRMTFGELDEAVTAARRVHRVHERIRGAIREDAGAFPTGHRYEANDRASQMWVLATLWDTTMLVFERVFRPLDQVEKDRFYEEGRRVAMLFGLDDSLPPSHQAFRRYVTDMLESDVLTVTRPAVEIAAVIMRPENWLGRMVRDDYGILTANLLPERIARDLRLERGGADGARRTQRVLDLAKLTFPRMPRRLRFLPAYVEAQRRIQGATGRDRIGEALTAVYVGRSSR